VITDVAGQAIELAWTNNIIITGNTLEKEVSDTGAVKSTNVIIIQ
jgi:hypothetical protein